MRITILRRVGLIAAATGLIGGSVFAVPAQASVSPTDDPSHTASELAKKLGSRSAGSYFDRSTKKLVVTVTSRADAKKVRAAGAVAEFVPRSGARLQQAISTLERTAAVPGTAWAIDPTTDQVVVSIDSSVTGAKLTKVTAAVERLGHAVRVEHVPGVFSPRISGGDAIYGGGYRCSLGFNVRNGSTYYFLTAGHCGNIASTWYAGRGQYRVLGRTRGSSFPVNDYAIVRYTGSASHPGTVGGQDITEAGKAYVGEIVYRRGSTTGRRQGRVTALHARVNYREGSVYDMIKTTVCAEGGDSGGPLYDGGTALGLTSGGSGNCTYGGVTFFQPVLEPLNTYGVNVY